MATNPAGALRARPLRAKRNSRGPNSAKAELAEAKTNQKAIADELQKMLDGLSEFETYRGVVKDAQELLKQHEQTMKQTAEIADKPEMIGKPLEALTPEQKAELANLSNRQSQVGKGLQNLQERMGEMARSDRCSRTRWRLRRCATRPRKVRSKGRPASSPRPPINWKRTRWGRHVRSRSRRAKRSKSWSTRSRTAVSASLPDWSKSSRTPRASWPRRAPGRPRT